MVGEKFKACKKAETKIAMIFWRSGGQEARQIDHDNVIINASLHAHSRHPPVTSSNHISVKCQKNK